MKKTPAIISTVSAAVLLTSFLPYEATAYTVVDNYYGADDHGYDDVIGEEDLFGISRAELSNSGTIFTFDIHTEFAGEQDKKHFIDYTIDDMGIGYGDLFLAGEWDPDTSENNYLADNATTGTQWEYVFSLGDSRWDDNGGGYLYEITKSGDILLTGDFMAGNAYWRDGQEVAYQPGDQEPLQEGTWETDLETDEKHLSFTLDLSGTRLANSNTIAFHWGETCGNDVIEAEFSTTPEPASLLLMGSGLIGLGAWGRRHKGKMGM